MRAGLRTGEELYTGHGVCSLHSKKIFVHCTVGTVSQERGFGFKEVPASRNPSFVYLGAEQAPTRSHPTHSVGWRAVDNIEERVVGGPCTSC